MNPVPAEPKQPQNENNLDPENVSVTLLNTRFGEAFADQETLDRILPYSEAGHLALVGFSEVTPGVRDRAVAAIEARGYKAIIPGGHGKKIDTVWAVSNGLEVETESTKSHPFPGRMASRPSKRLRRDAGMHTIIATTPGGRRIRASTERLAPPARGKRARYLYLGHMATLMDEHTPPDPAIDIDINGGDQNHANGPDKADRAVWEPRGFIPVLPEGSPTYSLQRASKVARVAARVARVLGKTPNLHFDELYIRPGINRNLLPVDVGDSQVTLRPDQIAYSSEIIPVNGSDHDAARANLLIPRTP